MQIKHNINKIKLFLKYQQHFKLKILANILFTTIYYFKKITNSPTPQPSDLYPQKQK